MRPPPLTVSSFHREKDIQVHMLASGVGGLAQWERQTHSVVSHGVQGLTQQAEVSHAPPARPWRCRQPRPSSIVEAEGAAGVAGAGRQ